VLELREERKRRRKENGKKEGRKKLEGKGDRLSGLG
jgi:hypothetical protein